MALLLRCKNSLKFKYFDKNALEAYCHKKGQFMEITYIECSYYVPGSELHSLYI